MKKYSVAAGLVALVLLSSGTALANEPTGFRGIPWGQEFETLQSKDEYVSVNQNKGLIYYAKTADDLTLGGAKLESLRYIFAGGRFIGVKADAVGTDNADRLLGYLRSTYGEGDQPIVGGSYYEWPFGSVKVSYSYDKSTDRTALSWITLNVEGYTIAP